MPQPQTPALPLPATLYLVAWTGGFEDPSFQSFTIEAEAVATYEAWVADSHDRSDRITLIEQAISTEGVVTTVKINEHCPAWGSDEDDSED